MGSKPALTLRVTRKSDKARYSIFTFWASTRMEGSFYGGPSRSYNGSATVAKIVMSDGAEIDMTPEPDGESRVWCDLLPPYDQKAIDARKLAQKDAVTMAKINCPDCHNALALCACAMEDDRGEPPF